MSERQAELAAAQRTAARRHSAIKDLVTRARRSGDPTAIASAEARARQAYAEFDRGSDAFIDEMTTLNQVRPGNLNELPGQIGRCQAADAAALGIPAPQADGEAG